MYCKIQLKIIIIQFIPASNVLQNKQVNKQILLIKIKEKNMIMLRKIFIIMLMLNILKMMINNIEY